MKTFNLTSKRLWKPCFLQGYFEENFFAVKNLPQIPTEKDTDFRRLTIRFGKQKSFSFFSALLKKVRKKKEDWSSRHDQA